jgi:hypothetical protein
MRDFCYCANNWATVNVSIARTISLIRKLTFQGNSFSIGWKNRTTWSSLPALQNTAPYDYLVSALISFVQKIIFKYYHWNCINFHQVLKYRECRIEKETWNSLSTLSSTLFPWCLVVHTSNSHRNTIEMVYFSINILRSNKKRESLCILHKY